MFDTSLIEMLCQKLHTHFCMRRYRITQCHNENVETIRSDEQEKWTRHDKQTDHLQDYTETDCHLCSTRVVPHKCRSNDKTREVPKQVSQTYNRTG